MCEDNLTAFELQFAYLKRELQSVPKMAEMMKVSFRRYFAIWHRVGSRSVNKD